MESKRSRSDISDMNGPPALQISLRVSALLVAAMALSACGSIVGVDRCNLMAYPPAFDVTVRDQAGAPQALGAVVTFTWASNRYQYSTLDDSVNVRAGGPGTAYEIQVSKRYYNDASAHNVYTPDLGCGRAGAVVTVPIVLSLVPGSPAVRSLYVLPQRRTLDRGGDGKYAFASVVDANVGTSHAVRWSLTGDTASVALDAATGILTYRCLSKSGYLTLTATSVADSTIFASAAVAVQGHPAATNDPPCS
jgi:hypothetical protein